MKFVGTLEDLKAIMIRVAFHCKWSGTRNHFQCRISSGAVLNWWASTGTITVQGPDEAAANLESVLEDLLLHPVPRRRYSERILHGDFIEVEHSEVKTTNGNGAMAPHQPVAAPRQPLPLLKRW